MLVDSWHFLWFRLRLRLYILNFRSKSLQWSRPGKFCVISGRGWIDSLTVVLAPCLSMLNIWWISKVSAPQHSRELISQFSNSLLRTSLCQDSIPVGGNQCYGGHIYRPCWTTTIATVMAPTLGLKLWVFDKLIRCADSSLPPKAKKPKHFVKK